MNQSLSSLKERGKDEGNEVALPAKLGREAAMGSDRAQGVLQRAFHALK